MGFFSWKFAGFKKFHWNLNKIFSEPLPCKAPPTVTTVNGTALTKSARQRTVNDAVHSKVLYCDWLFESRSTKIYYTLGFFLFFPFQVPKMFNHWHVPGMEFPPLVHLSSVHSTCKLQHSTTEHPHMYLFWTSPKTPMSYALILDNIFCGSYRAAPPILGHAHETHGLGIAVWKEKQKPVLDFSSLPVKKQSFWKSVPNSSS